ncbi:dihydrofolate reductase [Jeotgalibacillus haloalkalitolerans]|uniref:Dihydrofolate reductase n=1 Tax=Jeotgalibacillus haloalkalitolerans TaxID=3104292 RepID=A0ABU5KLD6_9BACL|nr:dihydrofolate reductase [Jeotgalibacillus sp. HH7-29]MDZ5711947.1 dihydrofolate reductase [Jeotgalibacillus sp. HH7-29]
MISMISAHDLNRVIGKDGDMPWHLPDDLKYFQKITSGHSILMGRKTFESMNGPLKNRKNIVLTRDENWQHEGAVKVSDLEEGMKLLGEAGEGFVIGGGEIYKMALEKADRLYITLIHEEFEGDTYFPEYSKDQWKLTSRVKGEKNEKNPYDYEYLVYDRI